MKYRYLVFGYDQYYPCGGMNDCCLKTNDLEEAKRYENGSEFYEIYDCETGKEIKK